MLLCCHLKCVLWQVIKNKETTMMDTEQIMGCVVLGRRDKIAG